jgi:hypothetical protein
MGQTCKVDNKQAFAKMLQSAKRMKLSNIETLKFLINNMVNAGKGSLLTEFNGFLAEEKILEELSVEETIDFVTFFAEATKKSEQVKKPTFVAEDVVHDDVNINLDIDIAETRKGIEGIKEAMDELVGNSENTGPNYAEMSEEDLDHVKDFMDAFNMLYFQNKTAYMEEFENEFTMQIGS